MRRITSRWAAIICCLALGAGAWVLHATENRTAPTGAFQVLIVAPAPLARDGMGACSAWRIVEPKAVAKLESYFPRYRDRPGSRQAGAWEAAWEVYFDLPKGETVRITVSEPGESAWGTGSGDLPVGREFYKFVEELQKWRPVR